MQKHGFLSAQSPNDPNTNKMIIGSVEDHIRQSFNNLLAVADSSGGDSDDIVKVSLSLCDLKDFWFLATIHG